MNSPLHRALDKQRDENMNTLKCIFCSILHVKLSQIKGLVNILLEHCELNNCITIEYDIGVYRVKLRYDLYTKQFREPPHTTFGSMQFPIDKEQMSMVYGEGETELTARLLSVMEACYDISKTKGYGNQYGGNWNNTTDAKTLAINEFRRLLEESKQTNAKIERRL
jgi:hypothetical protein